MNERSSGTNLQGVGEPPVRRRLEQRPVLLPLSAPDPAALRAQAARLLDRLSGSSVSSLPDIACSLATSYQQFAREDFRAVFQATRRRQLRAALEGYVAADATAPRSPQPTPLAFVFTGQGAQYPNMGRGLYETEPVFQEALDRCAEVLSAVLDRPLLEVMFDVAGPGSPIHQTAYTQPALFALEYGLYELWRSWGVEPDGVMGHSVGEIVAACVAEVLSLEDGLRLIAARGRLMQALDGGGAMVSIHGAAEVVEEAIAAYRGTVAIAAYNSPTATVISGDEKDVLMISRGLETQGIATTGLTVSHAFHSPRMDPMLSDFEQVASGISYRPPSRPLIGNLSGELAGPEIATPAYWVRHAREPVRFLAGLHTLRAQGIRRFVELGPSPTLSGLGRSTISEATWLPSLRKGRPDSEIIMGSLGRLFLMGYQLDWCRISGV